MKLDELENEAVTNLKPTNLTIFDLFQVERRYVVPLFQRPYVWHEEKQWKPLWDDLKAKSGEILAYEQDPNYTIRKHFLGAVVISQIKTFGRQIAAMDVIDGQQRLTTIQVLLYALRDFAKLEGYTASSATLDRITANTCDLEQEDEKYKLWPTSSDRDTFKTVSEAGSPDQVQADFPLIKRRYQQKYDPRPRLAEAYLFFYRMLQTHVYSADDESGDLNENTISENSVSKQVRDKRLGAFLTALTRHVEVVAIELEDGDDPQVIFETLNARGEPLLPSDLLRNFVFLEATRRREDVERLYRAFWSEYDGSGGTDLFWKEIQTQGRIKSPRLDVFVYHYLKCQKRKDVPVKHIYQEFREWWVRECPTVEGGLKKLQSASRIYRSLIQPATEDRVAVFGERLSNLDTGTAYPLVLYILTNENQRIPTDEIPGMLTDIESYIIRRLVCGLTPKNYNNVFVQVLAKLHATDSPRRSELRRILSEFSGESAMWPTDKMLETYWLASPLYKTVGSSRTSIILRALDLQLITSKQEKLHLQPSLTVEHVMPQSFDPEIWPYYEGTDICDDPSEDRIELRKMMLHSIGNLTLLTQPLNSSVSNGPFITKRPEITKQSALRLNVYFQQFYSGQPWDELTIARRGEELLKTAIEIWPGPDVTGSGSRFGI